MCLLQEIGLIAKIFDYKTLSLSKMLPWIGVRMYYTPVEEIFYIISKQDPKRVLSLRFFLLILWCCWVRYPQHYIFDESVFAFILIQKI